ncbi:hypothetical protein K3495_g7249 [Podosphaera aphanis]|nr:hypothetical protein K3495_g7249 [Podosphaera aphanis]
MYWIVYLHFNTEVNQSLYHSDWTTLTIRKMQDKEPGKSKMEALQLLFDNLQRCQRALGPQFEGEQHAMATLRRAVKDDPVFNLAMFTKTSSLEELQSNLRGALNTVDSQQGSGQYITTADIQDHVQKNLNQYYADRGYGSASRGNTYPNTRGGYGSRGRGRGRGGYRGRRDGYGSYRPQGPNKCYICGDPNCRSYKHNKDDQTAARRRWEDG